jgi:RNA polymerase sigma factor (sigma-70 family)
MVLQMANAARRGETSLASIDEDDFAREMAPYLEGMGRLAARLAPRLDPEDIVQNALIRAWRYRAAFDTRRGTLATWLLTITANEARRASRRWRFLPWHETGYRDTSPDDHLDLASALRRLSGRQRTAVECFYYAGLSISETAAVMGCSDGTVKSTLADARERLRQALEVKS